MTEKRNEFAQHDRVLQVTYTLKNDTENPIRPQQWSIENKDGEELYEYAMILDSPEYIESGNVKTINYYYQLPSEMQDYQNVVRRANGYFVGLPFTL
ncbi:hypothetical protein A5844_001902 [Enterococcus sp. 10A9_DIV0425]|uniref:Uncharacterized protein n=1 Tax=Candidatus Enterococcus wittei TaxID=1987383 RepID=A0A242JY06_9ENTE|nr:hypothetical protein [Enterococcus sp. 10A9_DIV0425]OTP10204.1 hypothetical protein A5844_001902 [Enterococcus sp. 10A9_DIV0425]THE14641.1 hypothetical protein E1H99_04125 [Enterococcus hirae]